MPEHKLKQTEISHLKCHEKSGDSDHIQTSECDRRIYQKPNQGKSYPSGHELIEPALRTGKNWLYRKIH